MQTGHDAVVLVADGRTLLFFRNKGDAAFPNLEAEAVMVQDNLSHSDQASDSAGRASSAGTSRATPGEMRKYYHKEVQSRLVGELAKDLTNHPLPEIERILAGR